LDPVIEHGTFLFPDGEVAHERADYAKLRWWMGADE
jgi:hypothetical protein